MLTKLVVSGFKMFERVEVELADRVVFIGPNNSGKTTALQALALWDIGAKRWSEKRGSGPIPEKRPGVTINRRDLLAVPVPATNLLWHDLRTQESKKGGGTQKIYLRIEVEGTGSQGLWSSGLEFYYANEESFYCRTRLDDSGQRTEIPEEARSMRIAYLPPMSGLAPTETRLDEGAINVRVGEGRTAEVLRNLCWQVREGENGKDRWKDLTGRIESLFGARLDEPRYVAERGEITLSYRTAQGVRLDISSCGRGQQQTLLLLAHMAVHPGSVLLLDEPDAHLEILRQRQIYEILTEAGAEAGSQIIAASHSEVILNEAADRDVVIAFVGRPHRIDDRGSQVLKALKEIGFEHYYQAEETGWVVYLEGATDLAMLRAFATRLQHPAATHLERPFVHYVGNQPSKARDHFHGLREAKPDLVGCGIFDHLDVNLSAAEGLDLVMWRRREFENYLCTRDTLLAFAESRGRQLGELFAKSWRKAMDESIEEICGALEKLDRPDPFGPDVKASDDFLEPVFKTFYTRVGLPDLMRKTDYHTLVPFLPTEQIDDEIREKLDLVVTTAKRARPRTD